MNSDTNTTCPKYCEARRPLLAAAVAGISLVVFAGCATSRSLAVPETRSGCSESNLASCVEEAKKLVAKGDTGRAFPYAAFAALRGSEEGSALLSKIRSGRISNQDGLQANLDAACRHGDLASCFALALAKGNRGGPEATAYLSPACDKGDLPACRQLGRVLDKGLWDVPKDEKRAVDLFEKACNGGELRGCSDLGVMYSHDRGVAKDEKRAVDLFEKACAGGDMRGCANLGVMFRDGRGVAKDEKRAVDLFQKACDAAEMLACSNLGVNYEKGEGVAKDEKRAVDLFQKVCDGGDMLGCGNLGAMYLNGRGVAKDEKRAADLFQKACDGGTMLGCAKLGAMYADGRGVAKNEKRALDLLEKACDGGEMLGCGCLGEMYVNGRGVIKDERRAADLYQKACDGGEMLSCAVLGNMYADGKGVAKDEKRAVDLYQKACDGGEMYACRKLGVAPEMEGFASSSEPRQAVQVDDAVVVEFGEFQRRQTGTKKTAKDTAAGWVEDIGSQYPELTHAGAKVAARLGNMFGIGRVIRGRPESALVDAHVKVIHPPITNPNGATRIVDEWDLTTNIGIVRFDGWSFLEPWAMVPGRWTIQLFHGDRKLVEQTFDVVRP